MAESWTDYTDALIDAIDESLGNKYKFTLRDFLLDPIKFSKISNISATVSNMKEDVDKYIKDAIDGMPDEGKRLRDSMAKADTITNAIAQTTSSLAKQNKVPIIKPAIYDRDFGNDETIYLDSADQSVTSLIEKLIQKSLFVADFSEPYKDHMMGEWLFGGEKNYVISVYLEPNEVLSLETSKEEIDSLMDSAASSLPK